MKVSVWERSGRFLEKMKKFWNATPGESYEKCYISWCGNYFSMIWSHIIREKGIHATNATVRVGRFYRLHLQPTAFSHLQTYATCPTLGPQVNPTGDKLSRKVLAIDLHKYKNCAYFKGETEWNALREAFHWMPNTWKGFNIFSKITHCCCG